MPSNDELPDCREGGTDDGCRPSEDKEHPNSPEDSNPDLYQADGTIHVNASVSGGEKINTVTFIPDRFIEQNGSKFIVFLPLDHTEEANQSGPATTALFVKKEKVNLCVDDDFKAPLLEAAVKGIKVTVRVSFCKPNLALQSVTIPVIGTRKLAE